MPRTEYAQPDDLQSLLETAEVFDESWNLDLAGALEKATDDLENDSGFKPFLSTGVAAPRRFTPDGPQQRSYTSPGASALVGGSKILFLEAGLLELESLKVDGREYSLYDDFFLKPDNADAEGKPFTQVDFVQGVRSKPQGIVIVGVWGFCRELPQTVWEGHRCKAALHLAPLIASNLRQTAEARQSSVVRAKESGPVRVEYAAADASKTTTLGVQMAGWQSAYETALEGRRVFGIS
jgi:hypothetical protein